MAKRAKLWNEAGIRETVTDLIVDQLGIDEEEVTPQSKISDDLGADSLDTVELVMCCEEEFDLEISDEDGEKMQTVNDIVQYLVKRLVPAGV